LYKEQGHSQHFLVKSAY